MGKIYLVVVDHERRIGLLLTPHGEDSLAAAESPHHVADQLLTPHGEDSPAFAEALDRIETNS